MAAAKAAGVAVAVQRVGSMVTPFFLSASAGGIEGGGGEFGGRWGAGRGGAAQIVTNYARFLLQCDTVAYGRFFLGDVGGWGDVAAEPI